MVKTKNGISKIVALVLIVALAVASLLLAIPKNSKSVYAAGAVSTTQVGLYQAGKYSSALINGTVASVRIKTYDELIADGSITETESKIIINNKDLEGDLVLRVISKTIKDWSGVFEGCTKLSAVFIDDSRFYGNVVTNLSRMFYGCTSLKEVSLFNEGFSISPTADTTNMFAGCSNLEKILITNAGGKTFADLGLSFTSYSKSDGTTYSASDTIPSTTEISLSGYKGSTTPSTPSTGVATDMLGFVVTAVIVVSICYVATRKKKVQR